MASQTKDLKDKRLGQFLGALDEHKVDFVLYDIRQDAHWIRVFRENGSWEIDSEDQDTVLFVRKNIPPSK